MLYEIDLVVVVYFTQLSDRMKFIETGLDFYAIFITRY